jgi:aryl-alcohol dehydrogenase-like predicted oxidoreductase
MTPRPNVVRRRASQRRSTLGRRKSSLASHAVRYVPLGPLSVSLVGLGCNNFGSRLDLESARSVVDAALDVGVTFFDTADIYGDRSGPTVYGNPGGSERFLGELLRGRRGQVVLATKFGHDMGDGVLRRGAPEYVRHAVDASLARLETDYVDLLYYHWPDGVTPIAETVGAMSALVQEGKARSIGVSNFTVEHLDQADRAAAIAALQNEYSLLARDAEHDVLPRCRESGIGFVPYYPLAAGLLTGKYRHGEPPPEGTRWAGSDLLEEKTWLTPCVAATRATFDRIERLEAFAQYRGHTLVELAIAELASQPGVASVIAGATSAEQVRENAAASTWQLTMDELAQLPAA